MPDIARFLGRLLGITNEQFTSDLEVQIYGLGARLIHPETQWRNYPIETRQINTVPESFYQEWREKVSNRKSLLRRILEKIKIVQTSTK